jgi:hypothetical protein
MCSSTARAANRLISDPYESQIQRHRQQSMSHHEPNIKPLFGATTFSEYLNTAARGWIQGQLSIYSVGSGVGKSTIGLANLVQVCCPRIYDMDKGQYVDNPCYQHKAGLYLQFEVKIDREIFTTQWVLIRNSKRRLN